MSALILPKKDRIPWGAAKAIVQKMQVGVPFDVEPRFFNAVCKSARDAGFHAPRRKKFVPGGFVFEITLQERKEAAP